MLTGEKEMLERGDFYNLVHFEYGEPDYGSYKGMRYRIALEPLVKLFGMKPADKPEKIMLRAYAWREPWSYTVAQDKEYMDFEYTEEGINGAIAWLNEEWEKITAREI